MAAADQVVTLNVAQANLLDLIVEISSVPPAAADQVVAVTVTPTSPLLVDAGADRVLEPGDTVALAAAANGQPDAWVWEQVGGTLVSLDGAGATRTYTAPYTQNGTTLTFKVTVTQGGSTAVDTVVHQVYPHTIWRRRPNGSLGPLMLAGT